SQYRPIWHPNVAKDAAGSYVSCSVPPEVTWGATCTSNVTLPHGPRIDGPQLDAAQGATRCAGFDQISAAEAADRDAWAIACDVVASRWMTSLLYDDTAYLIPRAKPLYPTFGNAQRVWHPDRTRDANGRFVSCAIPADITWFGTCSSN